MDTFDLHLCLCTVFIVALYLGIKLPLIIPDLHPLLDRKPFNCTPCLTFHLIWVAYSVIAIVTQELLVGVGGIILAFVVFGVIKLIDNNRIKR